MRVLCTCLPEYGHFHPMAPFAQALSNEGHEVAFATAADFCTRVEQAGFVAFPAGLSHVEQVKEARQRYPEAASLPSGQERFLAFVPRMVAGVAAPARAPALAEVVRTWRPDVVVHDEVELAGPVVAAAAGLPYAGHGVGILRPREALSLAGEVLAPLCRQWGVELGPLGGVFDYLYLDVTPPSLRPQHGHDVPVLYTIDASRFDAVQDEGLPAWIEDLPDRPTVYVTMGTLFNANLALFALILEALHDQHVNIIITVGHDGDPRAFDPLPANVRVERYIPQSQLLAFCDLVVAQGGWSVVGMLALGTPMLLLPQGANQFWHTEACVTSGAARRILPSELTAAAVRREARAILDDPRYRSSAERVRDEIAAMPAPEAGVALVERLCAEHQPVIRPLV